MKPSKDYIRLGVGAMIFNAEGKIFLAKRGKEASNEQGCWEFPGGRVEFGETLEKAIIREVFEEHGMEISVSKQLGAFDHILDPEKEHWVAVTYLCQHKTGEPKIKEPNKCEEIGWFDPDDLPHPLSVISYENLKFYKEKFFHHHSR